MLFLFNFDRISFVVVLLQTGEELLQDLLTG